MTIARNKKKQKSDVRASMQLRKWLTQQVKPNRTMPVSYKIFSNTVENLPDIAFEVQCCEIGFAKKTLDECAQWYYNAFYSEPSIRTKYEVRLKPCPMAIKQKLLQMPGKSKQAESAQDAPELEDGVEVKVKKHGRFLFPVSYATFTQYVDKKRILAHLLKKQTKDKEQQQKLLADKAECKKLLHIYYNGFYLFPKNRNAKLCNFKPMPEALQEKIFKAAKPLEKVDKETVDNANTDSGSTTQPQVPILNSLSSIVSFAVFEAHIKNLYQIAWRLKLNEPGYAYKDFEDSAFAYYLAFYLTPEIRDKYPCELKPCIPSMRERILALPNESDLLVLIELQNQELVKSQTALQENNATHTNGAAIQSEELVDVIDEQPPMVEENITIETDVVTCPTELQSAMNEPLVVLPVTFKQFKRYISNMDHILQQLATFDDFLGKSKDDCALKFYQSFYLAPQIRDKITYEFKPCPVKMREKLLQMPIVTDKSDPTIDTDSNNCSFEFPEQRQLVTIDGITYEYLVSFETFMRYVNYEELTNQLAREYEKRKGKSLTAEQLLKRFYYSFYIHEKLRNKYNYIFNAAPAKLKDRLMQMAKPLESEHEKLTSVVPQNEPTISKEIREEPEQQSSNISIEKNCVDQIGCADCELDVIEHLAGCGLFKFPVSISSFKRCINYDDLIGPLLRRITQDETQLNHYLAHPNNLQSAKIFKRYYHSFYVRPITRSLYKFQFRNVSAELLQKLLEYAQPLDEGAKKEIVESAKNMANEMSKQQDQAHEELHNLPVTFKLFKTYVKNFEGIVQKMLSCEEYQHKTEEECALMFYRAFYTQPEIRNRFEIELKPCPAKIRAKLLTLPTTVEQRETESQNSKPAESDSAAMRPEINIASSDQVVVLSEQILISVKGVTYEFPISFEIFKKYINYETLKIELAKSSSNNSQILNDEASNVRLLKNFYHSFYIDESVRKMYNYNFNAAPADLQSKLLQYAVPHRHNEALFAVLQTHTTPSNADSRIEELREEHAKNEVPVAPVKPIVEPETYQQPQNACNIQFPVSFNIFLSLMRLESVVKQMQQEAQYAQMSENECKRAFFEAFYTMPEVRKKYSWSIRSAPADFKAKLLEIPQIKPVSKHSDNEENFDSLTALHADRKAELAAIKISNVVEYMPLNLTSYIDKKFSCSKRRALLAKHFKYSTVESQISTNRAATERPITDSSTLTAAIEKAANSETSPTVRTATDLTESRLTTNKETEQEQGSETTRIVATPESSATTETPNTDIEIAPDIATILTSTSHKIHNLMYLLYTSNGLKKTIWLILSRLSFEEFKTHTFVYGGISLYGDDSLLNQLYEHVILKGNWPINLFVKFDHLQPLLQSKGVIIDNLDLMQLSPKILHWSELMKFSNLSQVAADDYKMRTGKDVNNSHIRTEVAKFYTLCWTQDQWIADVQCTIVGNKCDNPAMSNDTGNISFSAVPLCLLETNKVANDAPNSDRNASTANLSESDCPPTQMETSFVDMENVCPASQALETQNDPLFDAAIPVQIKMEPIKFLNFLRFSLDGSHSEEFNCEVIGSEEQVISLDSSDVDQLATEFAEFAIPQSKQNEVRCLQETVEYSPAVSVSEEQHTVDNNLPDVTDRIRSQGIAEPVDVPDDQPDSVRVIKHKNPPTEAVQPYKKKRPRIPDNVPQFRHEFRALPLTAMVRIENNDCDAVPFQAVTPKPEPPNSDQDSRPMTTSQELATDNTLLASSQLQHLLDAPFVSIRKVNEQNVASLSDKHAAIVATPLNLHTNIVFCELQRFMFFKSLTTAQISKYQINSISVGSPYQQALICANGRLCNVYGPLLEVLFPQCSSSLLTDLQHLLWVVSEFNYNYRRTLQLDTTEDLRYRVLNIFMKLSTPFSHFRLNFENESREWAVCSPIDKEDSEIVHRKPSCDISSVISPKILERMKQIKGLYYHQYYNEN